MSWIEPSTERYETQLSITGEIDKHLHELREWTGGRSHYGGIEEQPSFIELLKMGDRIVNYIMHLMTQGGFRWEYCILLRELTGDKIPPMPDEFSGRLPHVMAHIILWWVDSEYYKNNNVYFGLVQ